VTVTIQVGYNLRSWVSYEVKDATPEEIEILRGDDDAALALGMELDEAGRLIEQSTDHDDNPEIFTEAVDASIIDVTVTDD
jgi:hypothetical protein